MPRRERAHSRLYATRKFTDRVDFRKAFHALVDKCIAEEGENYYIIDYYGIGGVGKTRLLHQLAEEIGERIEKQYVLILDFEDNDNLEMVSALQNLKDQFLALIPKAQFPMFELGLYALQRKKGNKMPLEKYKEFLSQNPTVEFLFEIGEELPILDSVISILKKIDKYSAQLRNRIYARKKEIADLEQMDADTIKKNIPLYFCMDIDANMQKIDSPLVLFIDTYERICSLAEGEGTKTFGDDWICGKSGLARNLGYTCFVVAGRERINWEKHDFWIGEIEYHLIDHLSKTDSIDFLQECNISDIELCNQLFELTQGEPVYLDLCVDQYEELIEQGIHPGINHFGKDVGVLVDRHLQYIEPRLIDCIIVMACMKKWTKRLLSSVLQNLQINLQPNDLNKIHNLSYVYKVDYETFSMHSVVAGIIATHATDEMKEIISRTMIAFSDKAPSNNEIETIIAQSKSDTINNDSLHKIITMVSEMKRQNSAFNSMFVLDTLMSVIAQLHNLDNALIAKLRFDRAIVHLMNRDEEFARKELKLICSEYKREEGVISDDIYMCSLLALAKSEHSESDFCQYIEELKQNAGFNRNYLYVSLLIEYRHYRVFDDIKAQETNQQFMETFYPVIYETSFSNPFHELNYCISPIILVQASAIFENIGEMEDTSLLQQEWTGWDCDPYSIPLKAW